MTSHARAKTMAGSASRSEEISPETFASWTTLIPDAIRTVLYGNSGPGRSISSNRYDAANLKDVHRLQELETENARLTKLGTKRERPPKDCRSSLQVVLKALISPLAAEGAAIIALDEQDGTPLMLIETGHAPSFALLGETSLLKQGSRAPSHGISADHHPILAGPWEMPSAQRTVLVFWRRQGAKSWEKKDHAMVQMAAATSAVRSGSWPVP
jgi:hypothetical protein